MPLFPKKEDKKVCGGIFCPVKQDNYGIIVVILNFSFENNSPRHLEERSDADLVLLRYERWNRNPSAKHSKIPMAANAAWG